MVPRLPTPPQRRRPTSWLPKPHAKPVAHMRKLLGGGQPAPQGSELMLALSGPVVVALALTMLAIYFYRRLKPAKHHA